MRNLNIVKKVKGIKDATVDFMRTMSSGYSMKSFSGSSSGSRIATPPKQNQSRGLVWLKERGLIKKVSLPENW